MQLIVEFAKRLPGFDKVLREDQIALLKACSSEVNSYLILNGGEILTERCLGYDVANGETI